MRRRLTLLTFATLLVASSPAWADSHSEAVRLFDEGRRLRDKGELEKALATFQASVAAEPSIGAFYNIGLVSDSLGKPQDAVEAYRLSAELARGKREPTRIAEGLDAIAKVREAHNYVTLQTAPEVVTAPGLHVVFDGEAVPASLLNADVFRAPLAHEIVITARGRRERRLRPRNKEVATILLGDPIESGALAPPAHEESNGGWGWQKWTGVGLAGAGLITAAVGTVVALGYYSDRDAIVTRFDQTCNHQPQTPCKLADGSPSPVAVGLYQQASDLDASATRRNVIVFSVAGLLVAGGAVVFFTAPRSSEPSPPVARVRFVPQLDPRDTGLLAVGTF